MNAERLLNVAKALRESPAPAKFSMEHYVKSCGTPACALGHYAARQDLQDLLRLATHHEHVLSGSSIRYVDSARGAHYNSERVCEHFDLTQDQAEILFGSDGCGDAETALEAAEFIERFVAERPF